MDLFDQFEEKPQETVPPAARPLADRMRPRSLDEFLGQEELVGKDSLLRRMMEADELRSMIFWGPPGSGKTTLAHVIANMTQAHVIALSAVTSGIADIKRVIAEAQAVHRRRTKAKVILFIDEIHRFNRIQQDALLPHVEGGTVILIGSTTENPSFSVIAPLLSRCPVFTLSELTPAHLETILKAALGDSERGFGSLRIVVEEDVLGLIAQMSDGDARRALNLLEMVICSAPLESDGSYIIRQEHVKEIAQRKQMLYDATGEQHYNLISAFHKSLRGSDPQAAVYWLVRMLRAGEDPLFILRRMLVFAAEDVGNADPQALQVVVAAREAFVNLGQPEGEIPMTMAVAYLATAPKSNASYRALNAARDEINKTGSLPVPLVIRNAPTRLMKELGYGTGYLYDHEFADHFAPQEYLPDEVAGQVFYEPGEFGFEREIRKRMDWWDERRKEWKERNQQPQGPKARSEKPENGKPKIEQPANETNDKIKSGQPAATPPAAPKPKKRAPSKGGNTETTKKKRRKK
jgi:putative ATPase